MLPSITLFGRTIGTYGVCTCLGLLTCGFVATPLCKRYKWRVDDVVIMFLVMLPGMLIGGHLMFGITNTKIIIALIAHLSTIGFKQFVVGIISCFGGMVFYGGLIGALVALGIYCKLAKKEKAQIMDVAALCIPLFHVFGRIGCFLGGCCYGIECSFGFTAHGNTLVPELNDVSRLPVQLIEAGCNLIIFATILFLFLRQKQSGKLIYIYLLVYPVVRFILEFFRGDAVRGFLAFLSTSQWISVALLVYAVVCLLKKKNSPLPEVVNGGAC